ncbi:MAG: histidinol-phosphate transaminase [Actinomycetaceae bacterium]|nr:histidinol-phosphate transaminase [Actinomycetaceae bacterium]
MPTRLPVRPEFADEQPYGAPQLDVPICLNVNENPYPPSPELIASIQEAVGRAAASLNRYPDRECINLRADLVDYLAEEAGVRLSPEQIWAANGSNEIISQLMTAFVGTGRTVLSFAPTYSMYPEYARNCYARYLAAPRTDTHDIDIDAARVLCEKERPAIILLASPNNPTGTALPQAQLVELLEIARTTGPDEGTSSIVVVDEAYGEFRREGVPSALELLDKYDNLVVSRTMSKAFGAAGLRLGYMAASQEIVDQIRVVRLPYHLSAITQAAARAALAHRAPLREQVAAIRCNRDRMADDLRSMGLTVLDSDANFVLFGTFDNRHALWQAILERGILIREVGPEGFLRVSIGTDEENAAFLVALKEVIHG